MRVTQFGIVEMDVRFCCGGASACRNIFLRYWGGKFHLIFISFDFIFVRKKFTTEDRIRTAKKKKKGGKILEEKRIKEGFVVRKAPKLFCSIVPSLFNLVFFFFSTGFHFLFAIFLSFWISFFILMIILFQSTGFSTLWKDGIFHSPYCRFKRSKG